MNIQEAFDDQRIDEILTETEPELVAELTTTVRDQVQNLRFVDKLTDSEADGLAAVLIQTFIAGSLYTRETLDLDAILEDRENDPTWIHLTPLAIQRLVIKAIEETEL